MKVFHEKDFTTENLDAESTTDSDKKKKLKKEQKGNPELKNADTSLREDEAEAKKAQALDDVSIVQEFYEEVALQKRIDLVKRVTCILLAVVFLFLAGGYLIYLYSDVDNLLVGLKVHQHVYSETGVRHDGDCRHYGYWSYACTVPYCKADKQIWDTEPGNHKYNMTEYEVEERENGDVYYVYTCDICGGLNYRFISHKEG